MLSRPNLFRYIALMGFMLACLPIPHAAAEIYLAQGLMSGEATADSVLLQTRLTATPGLNDELDVPGADGVVAFEYAETEDFANAKRTEASDAKWKILLTPTPMVGPDDAYKTDNHVNLGGFRHEADAFFAWLNEQGIKNFFTFCGDRHWQFHSIHPSGVEEFACGALNDENSRKGVAPGDPKGTDPERKVKQPYTYPELTGGFLNVVAGDELIIEFRDDTGKILHTVRK